MTVKLQTPKHIINNYSMEQRPSWEANSSSDILEHPPPAPILSHIIPLHALLSYLLKIEFNNINPSTPSSSKRYLSLRFPRQRPVCTLPLSRTCHVPRPSHPSVCPIP